ncbi:hypothetical protein Ocin01_07357, partial [Orchesella cincta]
LRCDRNVCLFSFLVVVLTICVCFFVHRQGQGGSTGGYATCGFGARAEKQSTQLGHLGEFKDCGFPMEGCGDEEDPDFMVSPSYCRCDEACVLYGNCCVTVVKRLSEAPVNNTWRCVRLPGSDDGVRMIRRCPSNYADDFDNRRLCERPESECKENEDICPWVDLPVIHNATRHLYANIYCARCHGLRNEDLYRVREKKNCTKKFVGGWEAFKHRAEYAGGLEWRDPGDSDLNCSVRILELEIGAIRTFVVLPAGCGEGCDQFGDLGVANLCHAYMQVVNVRAVAYKNPHCAKCDLPGSASSGQCRRLPARQARDECGSEDTGNGAARFSDTRLLVSFLLGIQIRNKVYAVKLF